MTRRTTIPNRATLAGLLVAIAPFSVLLVAALRAEPLFELPPWRVGTAFGSGLLLLLTAFALSRDARVAPAMTILAIGMGFAPIYETFLRVPAVTLILLISVCYLFFVTFPVRDARWSKSRPIERSAADFREAFRGALFGNGILWGVLLVARWPFDSAYVSVIFAASAAVPVLTGLIWIGSSYGESSRIRWRPLLAVLVIAVCALAGPGHHHAWLELLGFLSVSTAVLIVDDRLSAEQRAPIWRMIAGHPERLLAGTFLLLCVVGTVLLSLSIATPSGSAIHLIDAAFTAVSAVCVTGLIVLDTPVDFTFSGQLFILMLIQAGGLGIMTFSTAAIRLLGGKMSVRHEAAIARLLSDEDRSRVFASTRNIISFTFGAEAIGALVLTICFLIEGDAVGQALWRGVFTSISAFCNAGFALQSSSLVPYASSPAILHAVATLIILGGLSPVIVLALPSFARTRRMTTQAKVVLTTTMILLIAAFTMFLSAEWSGSLGDLSFADKLHNAWFQSVTLRTAGFNSIDLSMLEPATYMTTLLMMFIGGSPGGTAGGIKTTTFAVLALSIVGTIRGRDSVEVFQRTISQESRNKAVSIFMVSGGLVFITILGLSLTQVVSLRSVVFEAFSAAATVGLSIGATAELDGIGKTLIIVAMFLGRIGPLSLFLLLDQRRNPPRITRPEVQLDVG